MKRRDFLQTSAMGLSFAISQPGRILAEPLPVSAKAWQPPESFELEELTISELQQEMARGKYTSKSLVKKYLERIAEVDKSGPLVNSVIELNPDAESIADALDRERKSKGARGPLHGIPILIKDNIDTADRMMTTAGSLALLGSKPADDAFIVKKLRDAGAVILGKTNLSEWANIRSTHSSSGWSGRGGQTKKSLCPRPQSLRLKLRFGSGNGREPMRGCDRHGDGWFSCLPSSANSLVGIKPTLGLISRSGIIPIAHSQDTAGPMTRTVADAAILLGALTGTDSRDSATQSSGNKSYTDYTRFLDKNSLRGARLGIARKFFGFNDQVDKTMNALIQELKRLGAVVVDPAEIPTSGQFDESELEVLLYEFKTDLNAYLAGLGPQAPIRSLKQIIEFNEKNREREMPYFGQELFIRAEAKGPLTSKAYLSALQKNRRLSRTQGIDFVIRRYKLDALIAPTGGPAWPTDWLNGDHFTGGYSTASAVAGYPHITVPAGYVFGLPFGISFFGAAYSEPKLIGFAYAFEQATKVRRRPQFLSTVSFKYV